eukprot:9428727-Pyramimonas_sp.AAC.1
MAGSTCPNLSCRISSHGSRLRAKHQTSELKDPVGRTELRTTSAFDPRCLLALRAESTFRFAVRARVTSATRPRTFARHPPRGRNQFTRRPTEQH